MSYLSTALGLVRQRDDLQTKIESILAPSLQEYIDFLPERGSSWVTHHKNSYDFTFIELDGRSFIFESTEFYHYGENETDHISLPFEFVESPETYKALVRKEIEDLKRRKEARTIAAKQERVDKLKAQLAAAEKTLAKAQESDDLIATVAAANDAGRVRSALHREVS